MSVLDQLPTEERERRLRFGELTMSLASERDAVVATAEALADAEPQHATAYLLMLRRQVERLRWARTALITFGSKRHG